MNERLQEKRCWASKPRTRMRAIRQASEIVRHLHPPGVTNRGCKKRRVGEASRWSRRRRARSCGSSGREVASYRYRHEQRRQLDYFLGLRNRKRAGGAQGAYQPENKSTPVGELAGEIKFWDLATGEEKLSFAMKGPVTSLSFSLDGQNLAIGLLHDDKLSLKKEGGFEPPPGSQKGAVVLCELKAGKP
jgi:WD40 repeat protein